MCRIHILDCRHTLCRKSICTSDCCTIWNWNCVVTEVCRSCISSHMQQCLGKCSSVSVAVDGKWEDVDSVWCSPSLFALSCRVTALRWILTRINDVYVSMSWSVPTLRTKSLNFFKIISVDLMSLWWRTLCRS